MARLLQTKSRAPAAAPRKRVKLSKPRASASDDHAAAPAEGAKRRVRVRITLPPPAPPSGGDNTETTAGAGKRRMGSAGKARKLRAIIRALQNSTDPIVPRAAVERYMRHVGRDFSSKLRFSEHAILAVRAALEDYAHEIMVSSYNVSVGARGCTTLEQRDIRAALFAKTGDRHYATDLVAWPTRAPRVAAGAAAAAAATDGNELGPM